MTHARTAIIAVTLASLIALAACGGDEGRASTIALTAEQAATVVDAGLLVVEDLPQSEWAVEEIDYILQPDSDDEGEGEDLFGSTPECQAFAAVTEILDTDSDPLANKERLFDAGDGPFTFRSVISNVVVPGPNIDLDETFVTLRDVFSADSMRPCFEAGMVAELESDPEVSVDEITVSTPAVVPEGGVAVTLDLDAAVLGIPMLMRMEMHMWPQGPAVGSLIVMEMNSTLMTENMTAILERAQQRLVDAVGGVE